MQPTYAILFQPDQEEIRTSQEFAQLLESFLEPLLLVLDQVLDKRLCGPLPNSDCWHQARREVDPLAQMERRPH